MDTEYAQRIMEAICQIINTDETHARASVGMLIDMVCAEYGDDPVEFAEEIAKLVKQVNADLGAIEARKIV